MIGRATFPLFPGIFPDQMAPIVRNGADGEREFVMALWGMPGPPQFGGAPITNIRNVGSPHWRSWLTATGAAKNRMPPLGASPLDAARLVRRLSMLSKNGRASSPALLSIRRNLVRR
jgi:hypothetical protein